MSYENEWNKEVHAFDVDRWDVQDYEDALYDVKPFHAGMKKIAQSNAFVNDNFCDLFHALHAGDPWRNEEWEMRSTHLVNHHISGEFQNLPDMEALRIDTRWDMYASAFTMVSLQPEIERLYEENEELMDLVQQLKDLIEEMRKNPDLKEEMQGQYDQLVQDIKEGMGNIDMSGMGSGLRQAMKDLQGELSSFDQFGVEDGELKRMSYAERRALADKLKTSRFITFAKLIGQFKMVAKGARRKKVPTLPDEIVSSEMGQDFTRMLLFQSAQMADPAFQAKFWLDWTNHELMQSKQVGSERMGSGPVIVICDESGSMGCGTSMGGTREMWAKAFTLALAEQCRKGKRDFHYIGFSSRNQVYVCSFPGGKIPVQNLVEFSEHNFDGGTDPHNALLKAKEIVNSFPAHKRPDIVFISDGEFAHMPDTFMAEWNEIKRDTAMKTFGVAFETSGDAMKPLCDVIIPIRDMTADAKSMSKVFEELAK